MKKRATEHDEFADIRDGVRALCAKFPGEYWRALDRERAYPTEFVAALTEAGYLAALIPEKYGGSGLNLGAAAAILEEVHASGGNGAAFDWRLIAPLKDRMRFILSGGLTPDNVAEAIALTGAAMVDVSSGVERAPGEKDIPLIQKFVRAAHRPALEEIAHG